MTILERFSEDLRAALKARDRVALETLRLLVADLKNEEIRKGSELEEAEAVAVIRRSIKRRHEAAEAFRKGGREEQAAKEEAEAVVLERYLPRQIGGEELAAAVERVIAETGAGAPGDLGKVMKALLAAHPGQIDGKAAQILVRQKLGG